jgi:GT2 family glycosyltransferase
MTIKNSSSLISRIAVLMTCHNRRQKTLACLHALSAQELPANVQLTVYLVDDGCNDGTGAAVRQNFPNVRVLMGNGNLFWCGGMRLAWKEAMKDDYDAYLWLNDDTILSSYAINKMLDTARAVKAMYGKFGIIVGSCYDAESGVHTYGGRIKRRRFTRLPDKPLPPKEHIIPCDTMNANLVLVTRDDFRILGNFSPEYTHAFGDTDYGMRAKKVGISIWVAPGYLAECQRNNKIPLWTDPKMKLSERWHHMKSPHGLPPKQWYIYVKRHTGWHWPFYFLKPIIRVLLPSLWHNRMMFFNKRII